MLNIGNTAQWAPKLKRVDRNLKLSFEGEDYSLSTNPAFNSRPDIPVNAEGMNNGMPMFDYIENRYSVFDENGVWMRKFWHLFSETPFDESFAGAIAIFNEHQEDVWENLKLSIEYFLTFNDGTEALIGFSLDGEYMTEEYYILDTDLGTSMAIEAGSDFKLYLWNMDINSLMELVNGVQTL